MPRLLLCSWLLLLALTACDRVVDTPLQGILHEDETFVFGGETRTYHFYEPASTEVLRPIVLLLHGGGAVIDNHIGLGLTDWPHQVWMDIAEEDGLYVVVPQGLDSQWNDCRADCDHCGDRDDVGFLVALLDDLSSRHDIDPTRVYAVGESNGGFMTLRLAQEAPERFAAMGVVIALMPADNKCSSPSDEPISIMFQVGTADPTIPFDGGQSASPGSGSVLSAADTLAYWTAHNQCEQTPAIEDLPDLDSGDDSTATRTDYDCPATGTKVSMISMVGAGHVPPSIEVEVTALWESIVGEQSHDFEGAIEYWEFFQQDANQR